MLRVRSAIEAEASRLLAQAVAEEAADQCSAPFQSREGITKFLIVGVLVEIRLPYDLPFLGIDPEHRQRDCPKKDSSASPAVSRASPQDARYNTQRSRSDYPAR